MRFLLQAGADPNLADWEHRLTPLHLAAVGKQAHMRGEVVQLLLAAVRSCGRRTHTAGRPCTMRASTRWRMC